jgi:hypothetical protein
MKAPIHRRSPPNGKDDSLWRCTLYSVKPLPGLHA